jgi:aryl-alcohol dehydrogenase-like predicted oxidoreductase
MMQYSILDRRPEESCLDLLHSNNIGVLARGGLAQGLLVNKSPKDYLNYESDEVRKAAKVIKSFSGKKRTAAQTALRFVLHHPAISSAIVGVRKINQLKEVVNTTSTPTLISEEINQLRAALNANVYEEHR